MKKTERPIEQRKRQEINPTYRSWCAMKKRCQNPNTWGYKYYGARGIKVCDRWQSYDAFLEDMGKRPDGATIERIDTNGNYEPSNCKWLAGAEQTKNRRMSIILTHGGKSQCVADWVRELGVSGSAFYARVARGWSVEKIFSTPFKRFSNANS